MAHHIHENDSMLAVGAAPWHGLGVTLAEPPATAAEALQVAGLDWTVSKQPMFLKGGQPVNVAFSPDRKRTGQWGAVTRDDNGDILGVVGPGFTPFQNQQMAQLYQPLIDDGRVQIETCGSLFNGRRVWMLGRFQPADGGHRMVIDSGDEVAKYLLLAHGHDGTFAVRFGFTPIRVVCNNTLSLATNIRPGQKSGSRLIRCLHTSNLKDNLETLRDAMRAADEVFELTAEQYRSLAKRGVSRIDLREYARRVVDAPEDQAKRTAQQNEKIGSIVGAAMEGRGNTGRNWWHAYNGVTEWLSHTACTKAETRLNSLWFGPNAELAEKSLKLALEMSA